MMIKIKSNDSIIDIVSKINQCKKNDIILSIPFGHPILHNYLSLKILKNKAGNKNITIVTTDLTSKKIGKSLGIKYSIINDSSFIEKENILKHNYTFIEYLKYEISRIFLNIKKPLLQSNKANNIKNISNKYKVGKNRLGVFLLGLTITVLLFLFIFQFAVNKTYIYITPEIEVKTKSLNFIFKEYKTEELINNEKVIKLQKISKNIKLKNDFGTTGIEETDLKKSKGKVVLINKLDEKIDLLPNSRLKSKSGVIFRIKGYSSIPPATKNSSGSIIPGEIIVDIESDIYDDKGLIIGKRGNIKKGVKLIFPGLEKIEKEVYAVTENNITGGNNTIKTYYTEKDLTNAKEVMEIKLKKAAFKEIKYDLKNDYIDYSILGVASSIRYNNLIVNEPKNIAFGDNIDNFSLSGSIDIDVFIFNKVLLLNKMKNIIQNYVIEDVETIMTTDNNSLRVSSVISEKNDPYEVKATMQVESFFQVKFLNKNNNYLEKLKLNILGLNKNEAEKILLNNQKISNVNIDIRPFFIEDVSKIPDNIIFKIED